MSSTGFRPTARDRVSRDRDIAELERRIELLERLDESIPGNFTRWHWGVCVLGMVYLVAMRFAGSLRPSASARPGTSTGRLVAPNL